MCYTPVNFSYSNVTWARNADGFKKKWPKKIPPSSYVRNYLSREFPGSNLFQTLDPPVPAGAAKKSEALKLGARAKSAVAPKVSGRSEAEEAGAAPPVSAAGTVRKGGGLLICR